MSGSRAPWGLCSFASGRDGHRLRESPDCCAGPSGGTWGGGSVQVKSWHVLHPTESSVARGVVSRGGRLQLSRLQPAQAGTYTCVAENAQAEARKDFVVAVLGTSAFCTFPCALPPSQALPPLGLTTAPAAVAPQIRSSGSMQEHSVLEGQEVRLDCEADGQPPPEVAWLKDGGPLGQGVGPHLR